MHTLILGYGNRSRTDDGVGWFVIEQLQKLALPGVELLSSHQLDVDLAETISQHDIVIFVDAATPESRQSVTRTEVQADLQGHVVAHYLTPGDVLALCKSLYRSEPAGILFSIRGQDFGFGVSLSPATERAAREVVQQIAQLVADSQDEKLSITGGRK
jgi:hydrogenase maturation protease